ncbi:DnaD domain protein [Liquorilactobacillus sicerae]|uniref:DnaD domain protein n=1 Tax=Liquorilactobacillus sicerae TaxID=1416943 RepID=UPI002480E265|nr:DnaD domain protein [Liquorilactobacillus sicerae]
MVQKVEFSPQTQFELTAPERILAGDQEIVLWLYQPLLGPTASSLYGLFQTWVVAKPVTGFCYQLLEQLNSGWQSFTEALQHLEALGLLRTFVRETDFEGELLFSLQRPQQPSSFFKDDLLRSLLLETVGEQHYRRLAAHFFSAGDQQSFTGKEISKNLLDVFQVAAKDLTHASLVKINQPAKSASAVNKSASTLDVPLLKQLLSKSFVDQAQVWQHQSALRTASLVYGLDEIKIVHLLENAANVQTDQVDFKLFFQLLHASQALQPTDSNKKSASELDKATTSASKTDTFAQQLLTACQAYAPSEFLQTLKAEAGSFVTSSERNLIDRFGGLEYLSPEVINVLIYYMIIDRDMPSLNRAFFEKVAADWKRKKVTNARAALSQIRQVKEKALTNQQSKDQRRQVFRSKRIIQKEKLPDWAREGYQLTKKSASSEQEIKKIEKELKKFKK